MIITSQTKKIYKVEMTDSQAADLQILLDSSKNGHVNELQVSALYGAERAESVHETIANLLDSLENR